MNIKHETEKTRRKGMDRKPLHRVRERLFSILNLKRRSKAPSSLESSSQPITSMPATSDDAIKTVTGIEALPVELKLAILCATPNLQTLKSLLRASPGCYRAFQSSKRKVLRSVIQQDLSPSLLVEVNAICKANSVSRDGEWINSVREVLKEWKDERKALEERAANGQEWKCGVVEEDDVIEIANLCHLVQGLTREFGSDALGPVPRGRARKEEGRGEEWDGKISEMEKHRIQRAMYRFQTFVALFGEKDFRPSYRPESFREQEMADLYFGNDGMRAWEVEELACVRDWMYRVYGRILEKIRHLIWEMDVESEREELRCFMKEGKEMEDRAERQVTKRSEYWQCDQREVLLMLGLPFLAKIVKAGSAGEKFMLVEKHLIPSFIDAPDFLTKALETEPEQSRVGYGHRHRRRRFEFEGDIEAGPNLAWVQSKKNRNREDQDCWFEDEAERWRQWGYCLWDEERLKGWGLGEWWRDGERRRKGRWVCYEQVRRSGRVVPRWAWVVDETE